MRRRIELSDRTNVFSVTNVIVALALLLVVGPCIVPAAFAQSSDSRPRLTFEVASVKPVDVSKMPRGHEGHQLTRERFVDRTELIQYIVRAYLPGSSCVMTATPDFGARCPLISGSVPAWVKTDRWEIQATMPAGSIPAYTARRLRTVDTPELNRMLQVLLEDRFHLKVHWEKMERPVYALSIGKNGPKLKPTVPGSELRTARDGTVFENHGMEGISSDSMPDGSLRTRLNFLSSSTQEAALTLSFFFERQVVDRTGLQGEYDFTLEYEDDPDARIPGNPFSGLTPSRLSNALQAVGLRFEASTAQVDVLVIDHVEKPSEN